MGGGGGLVGVLAASCFVGSFVGDGGDLLTICGCGYVVWKMGGVSL